MSELAQDLANKLGLKGRKAYVSPQTESTPTEGEGLGETSQPTGEVSAVVTLWILRSWKGGYLSLFVYLFRCPPMDWNL